MDANDSRYFAFGSNMNPDRIKRRFHDFPHLTKLIPQAKCVRLPGYRFAFNKYSTEDHTGKANIVKDDKFEVWGVLFRINDAALGKLKEIEGDMKIKFYMFFLMKMKSTKQLLL